MTMTFICNLTRILGSDQIPKSIFKYARKCLSLQLFAKRWKQSFPISVEGAWVYYVQSTPDLCSVNELIPFGIVTLFFKKKKKKSYSFLTCLNPNSRLEQENHQPMAAGFQIFNQPISSRYQIFHGYIMINFDRDTTSVLQLESHTLLILGHHFFSIIHNLLF